MKLSLVFLMFFTIVYGTFANEEYKQIDNDDIEALFKMSGLQVFKFKVDSLKKKHTIGVSFEEYMDGKMISNGSFFSNLPKQILDMDLVVDSGEDKIVKFFIKETTDSTFDMKLSLGGLSTEVSFIVVGSDSLGVSNWWEFEYDKLIAGEKTPLLMKYANSKEDTLLDCPMHRGTKTPQEFFKYCYIFYITLNEDTQSK